MTNVLKTTVLLAALAGVFIAIGGAIGGLSGMAIAFVVALLMNLGAYWFSGDIALRMAGAREVGSDEAPELHRLLEELATFAQLPSPHVAIIDNPSPNAFASGRDANHATVAVTTGLLDLLSRDELAGVLAHELGHVRNHDILIASVAATIAGAVTMLANVAQWSMLFGGTGHSQDDEDGNGFGGLLGGLLLIILAPIAAMLIQMAISRSREYAADAGGSQIAGNPYGLADALRKIDAVAKRVPLEANPATAHLFIVKPFTGQFLTSLFSSHPPTEDRIRALLGGIR